MNPEDNLIFENASRFYLEFLYQLKKLSQDLKDSIQRENFPLCAFHIGRFTQIVDYELDMFDIETTQNLNGESNE